MTWIRNVKTAGPIAALLAALVLAPGCGRDRVAAPPLPADSTARQEKPERPAEKESQPQAAAAAQNRQDRSDQPVIELTQQGVTLTWREKGQVRMKAKASSLTADEITGTGTLLDFSAQLYENGRLTAEIRAPKAVVDTQKRIVTATGGIILKSLERATTVRAEWIRWYAREQRVVGNAGVKIESAMGVVEAAAFEADTALKTLTVRDSAKGLKL